METDRRQHRRLAIRLPLECQDLDSEARPLLRSATRDISTGGLYFEADMADESSRPRVNSLLAVELTVPPGEGHFPYEGRVRSVAEVLRCEQLEAPGTPGRRFGIAARFREPLKLAF